MVDPLFVEGEAIGDWSETICLGDEPILSITALEMRAKGKGPKGLYKYLWACLSFRIPIPQMGWQVYS